MALDWLLYPKNAMNRVLITSICCLLLTHFSYGQVKDDHDLVKDGKPVTGMTSSQQKATSSVKEMQPIKTKEIPPLMESTLKDKSFENWQSGKIFYDDLSKVYVLKMDTVRTYYFNEKGLRLETISDTTAAPLR